jgi:hypothetical protein
VRLLLDHKVSEEERRKAALKVSGGHT